MFRNSFYRDLKNQDGFTFVEVIAGLALFTCFILIISIGLSTALKSDSKIHKNIISSTEMLKIYDTLFEKCAGIKSPWFFSENLMDMSENTVSINYYKGIVDNLLFIDLSNGNLVIKEEDNFISFKGIEAVEFSALNRSDYHFSGLKAAMTISGYGPVEMLFPFGTQPLSGGKKKK